MEDRKTPLLSMRDAALLCTGAGALMLLAMIVLVVVDVLEHDRVPDPVPIGAGLLGVAAVLSALALSIWGEVRKEHARLAALIELAVVGPDAPDLPELPHGAAAQIYEMGQRAGERRANAN